MKRTILTVFIVILIGASGFGIWKYWEYTKDKQFAEESEAIAKQLIEESRKTGEPSQQWVQAKFPENYSHSLNLWHPDNWTFECCGDTDVSSFHKVTPMYFEPGSEITIVDFVLKDCPKTDTECGIDELQDVTADQFFERERKTNRELFGNKSTVTLKNFKIPVLKFALGEFERYLINTGTGVAKVEFSIPKKLIPEFVSEFLNRLEPNPKILP